VAASEGGKGQRRVVIACQGGGSHTAFTAGVLKRLLGAEELVGYQVAGLSGTSGGAVCALLAWYALVEGDPVRAGRLLDQFWVDNSARRPVEMLVNTWIQWAGAWQDLGVALPSVSPYHNPASVMGADQFCQMLARQVDFDRIQVDSAGQHPVLLMGAVDVLSGRFRTFNSRRDRITAATVLASAAIPNPGVGGRHIVRSTTYGLPARPISSHIHARTMAVLGLCATVASTWCFPRGAGRPDVSRVRGRPSGSMVSQWHAASRSWSSTAGTPKS